MEAYLKDFTTLGIGGRVEDLISVHSLDELIQTIKSLILDEKKYLVIGSGSNLLVSDAGFEGTVVKNEISGIERDGNNLIVKSGTILQDLVDFSNSNGLAGLESLAGIPGTLGGAIYGNAGAYGQTISDHLLSVRVYDPVKDQVLSIMKDECEFAYRDSVFKKDKQIVVEAVFALEAGNKEDLEQISRDTIAKRSVKYPPGIKCPGSFFKNIIASTLSKDVLEKIPQEKIVYGKVPAGALLEMVDAQGDKIGDIKIAPYHANLFINEGSGSAKDFYALAKKYFDKVKDKFGIELEAEVQFVNLPPLN